MTIEAFSYRRREGTVERDDVQRRSLIDWCRLFAKPGAWKSVRSLALWCRLDENGQLQVAMHHRLFGQIRRGNLAPETHRRFVELCERYEVGVAGRTSRSRFVELTPEFLADLNATPCDGMCDDDGDAASRAHANSASHVPSHTTEVNDLTEGP